MKHRILNGIKTIEQKMNIIILYACESGSRGWGFSSPDSDYDVRFIYKRPRNYYLSINKEIDFLEFPIKDNLDINGWDIKKALVLISKSNATIFEWLQSPIIYKAYPSFKETLLSLCKEYFSCRNSLMHYLGMANNTWELYGNQHIIKIKHYYYLESTEFSFIIN